MTSTRLKKQSTVIYAENRSHTNYDTPTKAALREAVAGYDRRGPTATTPTKSRIYQRFGIPYSSAHRVLNAQSSRRVPFEAEDPEPRGRRTKLTAGDLEYCEHIIRDFGGQGRDLTWEQLANECNLDVSARTLQRHMGSLDYRRCIACRTTWVSPRAAKRRVDFAYTMLQKYPKASDWHSVRFSDEVHFGYGPEGRSYVTRMPGERYCVDCVRPAAEPEEKDKLRGHAWGAAGYSFKSELHWYNVGNRNGKMTAAYYRDHILGGQVKSWLDNGEEFVLEEDQDSAHGVPREGKGIVQQWKRQHGLQHYFNCSGSPDLSPIENCWQPLKQLLNSTPHWDIETIQAIGQTAWDEHLKQRTINKWVNSMPKRLREVIEFRGEMTGW